MVANPLREKKHFYSQRDVDSHGITTEEMTQNQRRQYLDVGSYSNRNIILQEKKKNVPNFWLKYIMQTLTSEHWTQGHLSQFSLVTPGKSVLLVIWCTNKGNAQAPNTLVCIGHQEEHASSHKTLAKADVGAQRNPLVCQILLNHSMHLLMNVK